jgi:undecaprenyl-diphosphatase
MFVHNLRADLYHLAERDLSLVRQLTVPESRPIVRQFALALNRLSNGWMYAVIVAGLLWMHPPRVSLILSAAALAVLGAHSIYPVIKRLAARPRPCDIDPSLKPLLHTLDKYSFPSGHCMTFTAVLIPITSGLPEFTSFAALMWILIAWARLAAAHHYPSDLLAGTALGAIVAWPITTFLI